MGSLVGHVAPGFGFLIIGLWHLFNHIKLFSLHPSSYSSTPWFPFPNLKYLEPILILIGSSTSIAMELFVGPQRHQPFDPDGTIPTSHLHNFEHASISLTIFIYASFIIILDRTKPPAMKPLSEFLAVVVFSVEFLMFHLHSTDHTEVEGQFHWLLQLVIFLSLSTTIASIGYSKSFIISLVRSGSIFFQGVWFIVIGYALWTPAFVAKGCSINLEEGRKIVRCHDEESLSRAKSLANLLFSWFVAGFAVFVVWLNLFVAKMYPVDVKEYAPLKEEDEERDLEMGHKKLEETRSFVCIGKGMMPIELER